MPSVLFLPRIVPPDGFLIKLAHEAGGAFEK